jgi:predicted nucleic acid-binding protein
MHVLQQELGAGEAEAIALATEIKADLLLMDERLGRETAHHLGLRCIGLIGILIEARRKGFITAVKPHLDALRNMAGFRIKPELYLRVLQDEGEVS